MGKTYWFVLNLCESCIISLRLLQLTIESILMSQHDTEDCFDYWL